MINIPQIKAGIVAVSRDCFPKEISIQRKKRVVEACRRQDAPVVECETLVENERDVLTAEKELREKGVNALVIYLGNFGPEGPLTMLAQKFDGPVMLCAAAEEKIEELIQGRGDAFCGMLNAGYNCALRGLSPYIPEYPVGDPDKIAEKINDFIPVARVILGLKRLKIFSFGPRPQDFLACNAPVKPLYDLGVEIMENSELDFYDIYRGAENHPDLETVVREMESELGVGHADPELLVKLARLECALMDFYKNNLGASDYGVFANKCWPSFEKYFECVPCYVNSRLATRGIPVACEVDIYGALSEYMITAATQLPATILDINNTVPEEMLEQAGAAVKDYKPTDFFMGFHCGNTPIGFMKNYCMKYQLIMHRLMEPGKEPNITRGTLEGQIRPGATTIFRLQSTADTRLRSYVAEGEILDIDPGSFGCIAVFAIREMARFYRHVLIEKQFPHHMAVAFSHAGKTLFSAVKMLGVKDIWYNQPAGMYYETENPFG